MGANQSAVYDDSNDFSGVVMPRRFGRILSFSSSSKWKSHLQVTRKTNKLVSNSFLNFHVCFIASTVVFPLVTNRLIFVMVLKMVIHFTAAWCGPCRTMDPVIREFAGIYAGVEFIKIDVDELEVCWSYHSSLSIG